MSNEQTAKPQNVASESPKKPILKLVPKEPQPEAAWRLVLKDLIKGREKLDVWVDLTTNHGLKVMKEIEIPTSTGLVTFNINPDTSCARVAEFLESTKLDSVMIEVVKGPKGGLRIGINGKHIPKLNLFVKK